jgi:DNA-binding winged helix-turn-helix (wHTH) protein
LNATDSAAFGFRFGTAEFDEARCELRVAGLPVEVEPRVLALLAYLLRHAGEVVTKEELLREVWAGRVTVDKVLPSAITKLRRALGAANAAQLTTQARIGYRLDGPVRRVAVGRQPHSDLQLRAGQPVPTRPNFALLRQLGRTHGSEVWLAEHVKTRELRAYKFALDGDRLRTLKREATLMRLLRDSLPDSDGFIELIDWNFEQAPYFLECEYGGVSLAEWAATHLPSLEREARLGLFLQIADAVAQAHSVGVLHKDLKPANVLVQGDPAAPRLRLTDFGSGHLLEPDRLEQFGITRMGMTMDDGDAASTSGTPLFLAPELYAGQQPTVRSDVYALGILLYQLLAARVGQPMAPGWEAEIDDELLREDLRRATDGSAERRLGSAAELAQRVRDLPERRIEALARQQARDLARRDRAAVARAQARRPMLLALLAVLALGIGIALWLRQQALAARDRAEAELQRATALARFLNDDLIGRSNPLVSAKGPDTTLREVLVAARDRVAARFATLPATEAGIRSSLASAFGVIDQHEDARVEAERALALLAASEQHDTAAEFATRVVLIRALGRLGRFDDAASALAEFEQRAGTAPAASTRQQLAMARAGLHMVRSEFDQAVIALRAAIDGIDPDDPGAVAQRDSLRLDQIIALTFAGQDAQAIEQGRGLIDEASTRAENSELLIALTRLALARAQGEDHAAAQALLMQARPVIAATLGENHSRMLGLTNELFAVSFRRGDWPQALEYAQQVHERVRAKFGDGNAVTWVTLLNWARTLSEVGRAEEAATPARSAFEHLQRLAGADAPQTQDAAFVLAMIELQRGQRVAAAGLIETLDANALESGRATGQWPAAINALRGIERQQAGDAVAARAWLDAALQAMREEAALDSPSLIYRLARQARSALD